MEILWCCSISLISALASKKWLNQKKLGHFIQLIRVFLTKIRLKRIESKIAQEAASKTQILNHLVQRDEIL